MKTVVFRKFKDCFLQHDLDSIKESESERNIFFEQGYVETLKRGFSHPQWIILIVLVILFLFGIKFRTALVLATTISFCLSVNWFYLKSIAEKIELSPDQVKSVREREYAKLRVTLLNRSLFGAENLLLSFIFRGSLRQQFAQLVETEIAPDSMHRLMIELPCDAGMGNFNIEEFKIAVSDPFNIFQFTVNFDESVCVEVSPHIESIMAVSTQGSLHSEFYGMHEVQSRGISVNFSSLRPYSMGDSIRHVAWRPSARHNTLIVKEFERMVNTDATVVLNLNPAHHVGLGKMKSWETAKDVCLAVVSQLIEKGNSVEFVYNYGRIEKSKGADQFYAISKKLVEHDMLAAAQGEHKGITVIDDPLVAQLNSIVPGTTLIYIGAVNYPYLRDAVALLTMLRRERVEVILVLVNPLTIWPEFRAVDPGLDLPGKTNKVNEILVQLQTNGIRIFFADMGGDLADHFREKPKLAEVLEKPKFSKRSS